MIAFRNGLLLLTSFILFHQACFAQIDQQKLDSMHQSIQESTDAYLKWQDSFNKAQMQKSIERSQMNTMEFVKQYQAQQKEKERQQTIRYIIMGVVLLVLLIVGLLRKRNGSSNIKSLFFAFALLSCNPFLNAQKFDSIAIQTVPAEQFTGQKIKYSYPDNENKESLSRWERKKQRKKESHAWGFIALIVLLAGSVVYEIYRIIKIETQP